MTTTFKNPSAFSQAYPPASTFDPARDIPSLTGKVAIVTGGYSGIGYETVKQLLLKDCTVYIFGRKQSLFDEATAKLAAEGVSNKPRFIECDLASYDSITAAVASFTAQESSLHMLFANGGVMVPPQPSWTPQGHELQFGTNVVGHWLLTRKLLPALEQASSKSGAKARVVFTSSSAADVFSPKGGIDYTSLKKTADGKNASKMSNWGLYGQSKIGDVIIANEFQRRHGDKVVFSSCNPGSKSYVSRRDLRLTLFARPQDQPSATRERWRHFWQDFGRRHQCDGARAVQGSSHA